MKVVQKFNFLLRTKKKIKRSKKEKEAFNKMLGFIFKVDGKENKKQKQKFDQKTNVIKNLRGITILETCVFTYGCESVKLLTLTSLIFTEGLHK